MTATGPVFTMRYSRSPSPSPSRTTPLGMGPFELSDSNHQHEAPPVTATVENYFQRYGSRTIGESREADHQLPFDARRSFSRNTTVGSFNFESTSDAFPGILLNKHESQGFRGMCIPMNSSIMFAASTKYDDYDPDTSSRVVDFAKTEEDVCFPMQQDTKACKTIDFSELDRFSEFDKEDMKYSQALLDPQTSGLPLRIPPTGYDVEKSVDIGPGSYDGVYAKEKEACEDFHEAVQPSVKFGTRRTSFSTDRFFFFASQAETTIYATNLSLIGEEGKSFENLFDTSKGPWWLDCLDPTDSEMRALCKAFGIHPLTAEDIRMKESREKVELFKNYYFVCFHSFNSDNASDDYLEPINVYMVVFPQGILTFHFSPIQHTMNVRRRIRKLRDYVEVTSDWICYAMIDEITDSFAPILREIEVETDVIEDSIFIARESDFTSMILRISDARKKAMILLRSLSGKADVIKMFSKRCSEELDNAPRSEIALYLGDILDHIITMHQNLSVCEKLFSRSHSNYLTKLQVESITSNNRITKVLGRITVIGTILVPLNLVTGLWGMNVPVPGRETTDLGWFFGIVGFIVGLVIVLTLIATRWLGEAESADRGSGEGGRGGPFRFLPNCFRRRFGGGGGGGSSISGRAAVTSAPHFSRPGSIRSLDSHSNGH